MLHLLHCFCGKSLHDEKLKIKDWKKLDRVSCMFCVKYSILTNWIKPISFQSAFEYIILITLMLLEIFSSEQHILEPSNIYSLFTPHYTEEVRDWRKKNVASVQNDMNWEKCHWLPFHPDTTNPVYLSSIATFLPL